MLKVNSNRKKEWELAIDLFKHKTYFGLKSAINKYGDNIVSGVKDVIWGQLYHWKPLTEKWLKTKKKLGLSQKILIASDEYRSSIRKKIIGNNKLVVGVPNIRHKDYRTGKRTGITLPLLAKYLEFGTRKMPTRMHWRPVVKRERSRLNKILRFGIIEQLKK